MKNGCEFAPIKCAGIPIKSPFGDELLQTSLWRTLRRVNSPSRERAPSVANLPLILSRLPKPSGLSVVPHWKACIVLAVYELSGCRNRSSRHNLSDENNSSSIIAPFLATNVEAQVYLLELGVKRNWETPEQF